MAKQLYDYWFVQFDFPNEEGKPYKSNGGEMVWNEKLKREIPKYWDCQSIKDFMRIFTGKKDVSKAIPGEYKFFSCAPEPITSNEYIYDGYAILVSGNGSYTGRVGFYKGKFDLYQRTYACVLDEESHDISFFYYTLKYLFQPIFSGGRHGSSIPYIVLGDLADFKFAYSNSVVKLFVNVVKSMFDEQLLRQSEIEALAKQRDELLPLLMNGQVSVNSDLAVLYIIYKNINIRIMKENIIQAIVAEMQRDLDCRQMARLKAVLASELHNVEIVEKEDCSKQQAQENEHLLSSFISAKKIEGCSEKTLAYYRNTIERLLLTLSVAICHITTSDIRAYLSDYQEEHQSSKVTIDNMRRIFSSFFAWLEDEDYIAKSPVRRIHKVKTDSLVKEVLSDEQLEQLRDSCTNKRDLALIDILSSTGIRVGELVKLNREDIDFHERQCVVFGKGNKERVVYFNARTKLHLQQYLDERTDDNPALFVSLHLPHTRLTISGVEVRIRELGKTLSMPKVHPHKFRRTLATMAIDKGMPIEQVQRLLGHVRIDTTLHYAIVNQNNVKLAHKKYLG
ncbi:tyrosine-type recombinase/integrase [Phocaeicola vulgatus]|nr:tyrosine-type recombinase/integrase [Phocaeicola vulgatus]MBV3795438.1 tyrosine-type recombinase/integrase [Phocaeicola vulgatus]MBV3799529.1 tyrosine-type recombinase/integrase [Phocaeicola vulgatus]MBV3823948.1 tyrosine-type recombinase/integrase [Phocaeicola vulgatus]